MHPRMLFLGSYPPRECGIATFTRDVVASYDALTGDTADIIAIDEPNGVLRTYPPEVVARLAQADRCAYKNLAQFVNAHPCDVLNVQHEYGLFGGANGDWLLDALEAIEKPIVTSLHTVLPDPNEHHLATAKAICERSRIVVVLSETGRQILVHRYGIDPERIRVIHHGVPDVAFHPTESPKVALGYAHRMIVSTFGLINRSKGIEVAIEAMRAIVERHPETLYLVLGETHPVVRKHDGEEYREYLEGLVEQYGLRENVTFVNRYLDFSELVGYLQATDIYLTPYHNPVQIVSGTLAYALGCGKAIVSTPYLYAREVLASERGFLVDFQDAAGIARTISQLLDEPGLRKRTEWNAYRFSRRMIWPNVAVEYARAFATLCRTPALVAV